MNTFFAINIEYLRASRTIETVLVSNSKIKKLFFVYNYEGYSLRVFSNRKTLENFFQGKFESKIHFESETELDEYFLHLNLKQ